MPTCAISAIDWPSPVVNQFEPRNCRRAVIKRIGWIASGSVNADIDCDCAALQPGKRLRGVCCGGTARGAIDEYVHAELLCMPLHPSRDRSIAERQDLDTVRRQRFQLCKHVTIAAKAENARRSHGKGE